MTILAKIVSANLTAAESERFKELKGNATAELNALKSNATLVALCATEGKTQTGTSGTSGTNGSVALLSTTSGAMGLGSERMGIVGSGMFAAALSVLAAGLLV
jgi:hypothetical protein